ncbi:MAG TPA: Holliday junction branch migration protein RuvA [Saprospiraceae bacterium]|nr:Holliday junction branch migration protein RuvA [Saprospiraceae bacterium]HPG07633.1 Holliday junction branch migration protein RuvA [Saprospiraceae bacterium]HRV84901.1 Holliday junction branch migration protein RuvA [Saprospiraceae bacterium]
MIAYIRGKFTFKSPTEVISEVQGIGYQIHISLNTYGQIKDKEDGLLYTHLHIKEDAHTLYGFADRMEKQMFQHLISVSGVGPSTAQVVLSSLSPDQVSMAILSEDERSFGRVKGIGPKTAKRIIIDLKDKVGKVDAGRVLTYTGQNNTNVDEALSALVALGFNRTQAQKAINELLNKEQKDWSVEALVKEGLRKLAQ